MNSIDSVTILVAIVLAGLGLALGFGRTLKFFTKGIFGFILSVFVCFTFGGMIAGIPAVAEQISSLNDKLGETWSFLQTIRLATVIYYVVLFFAVQIVRILVVKCVAGIFSADVLVMRIINRFLGGVLMVAAVFLLLLLALALLKVGENTSFGVDMIQKIEGTFIGILYENNPVKFVIG